MRTLPATAASFSPSTSSASGRSPAGRLTTIPNAPSLSCRTIRMTVRSKRGSPIDGEATSSWPASETGACAAVGGGAASSRASASVAASAGIGCWCQARGHRPRAHRVREVRPTIHQDKDLQLGITAMRRAKKSPASAASSWTNAELSSLRFGRGRTRRIRLSGGRTLWPVVASGSGRVALRWRSPLL